MASQKSPDTLRRLLVDLCTRSPPPRIILVYSLQQNWKNLPNLLLSLQAETHLSKKFGHIHPLGRNNSDCCARRKFSKNSQNQGRSTDQIPYFFSFLYSVQNGEEEVILETRLSYVDILIGFLSMIITPMRFLLLPTFFSSPKALHPTVVDRCSVLSLIFFPSLFSKSSGQRKLASRIPCS